MPHHWICHLQGKNLFLIILTIYLTLYLAHSWKIQNLCQNRWIWTSLSTMRPRLGQSRSSTWERLPSALSCHLAPIALCPPLLSPTKRENSSSESSLSTWTTWSKCLILKIPLLLMLLIYRENDDEVGLGEIDTRVSVFPLLFFFKFMKKIIINITTCLMLFNVLNDFLHLLFFRLQMILP